MKNKTLLKYHSWTGLIAGLFLILMGISGTILVFQHDIEDVLWKDYIQVENFEGLNIDQGFQKIQQEYGQWDIRLMHFEENEALIFNLRKPTERLFVFVHPTSGEIIKEVNELTTFTRWLLKFHYSFQSGPWGRLVVLIVGVLFFISLLTGLIVYRKSIMDTLLFRTRIKKKNKRSFYSSLHRIVGVWALLLNLLLVITGTVLAWTVTQSGFNPPAAAQTPAFIAPIETALEEIKVTKPHFTPTYIRLPLNEKGYVVIYGIYEGDPFYFSEFGNYFLVDHRTGEITGEIKITKADLSTQLSNTLIPLHFGQYGGIWSKLLYALVGLSGPFLSISGFIIWRQGKKRKKKKRLKARKKQEKVPEEIIF
ncbi:PepSY-associated TM helix domain-containing protein [Salinimicrobium catena]|uniref:PepSY-associated TM helix domain-containing protein n=1 Tax=Salinimicrobium catena TaxID=390640 RepID=UPI002FE4490C